MRPTNFKSAEKIYTSCIKGLSKAKRLEPADDDKCTVTITTWVSMIKAAFEERGMDTVMHPYYAKDRKEVYMLDKKYRGRVSKSNVELWIQELQTGVYNAGSETDRFDVCPFDLDNLAWSGRFIMNSITTPLWETIEKKVGAELTDLAAFYAIIQDAQVLTASMVQNLTNQLAGMSLKQELEQDVNTFANKVFNIAHKIDDLVIKVPNLNSLVLAPFMQCVVEAFQQEVTNLHKQADRVSHVATISIQPVAAGGTDTTPTWHEPLSLLKQQYRELKGAGLWTPMKERKKNEDLAALKAEIKQSVGGSSGNSNKGGFDKSKIKCHKCGKYGHFKRECPLNQSGGSGGNNNGNNGNGGNNNSGNDSNSSAGGGGNANRTNNCTPPGEGQPKVRMVNGVQ